MKYATWVLDFTNFDYGTGPEKAITVQGGSCQGAYPSGDVTKGSKILGYFTGEVTGLEAWSFTEISQQEALEFVMAIDETAHLTQDGRIAVVLPELIPD